MSNKEKQRHDYGKVLILSQSGNGKTFMGKTADFESTGFINISRKSLPFKGTFKYMGKPKTWEAFLKNFKDYVENSEIKNIIIDDITMAFDALLQMCQMNLKGYDVFAAYNKKLPEFLDLLRDAQKDIIVTGHDEILLLEGFKQKRAKVHGKQFEGALEKYFTTVLYADKRMKESKPEYFLRTFEMDTSAKCPEGLFSPKGEGDTPLEIPNDAGFIFKSLEEYYS
jgi:hypothetical protein